jgi:hypothetical protein
MGALQPATSDAASDATSSHSGASTSSAINSATPQPVGINGWRLCTVNQVKQ